jgi:thiamine transport system ATP-binding protein
MLHVFEAEITLGERRFEFSLELSRGSTLAIVGKSGAGKSTLLNLIAGFLTPSAGDILWEGRSIVSLTPDRRPVTSLFQSDNLFEHINVERNVALGLDPGLALDRRQWVDVHQALDRVGLGSATKRMPGSLSGGERQRVGLARCLVRKQPVLLLDEPYSALDSETRQSMLELTLEVIQANNLCTLLVSHNRDDAVQLNASVVSIVADRLAAGSGLQSG